MGHLSALKKISSLFFLLTLAVVAASTARAQILEDARGQSVIFKQDGNKFVYTIHSPIVYTG
jgi:hypothetical protein